MFKVYNGSNQAPSKPKEANIKAEAAKTQNSAK